jgi:segregation and condensation protein A
MSATGPTVHSPTDTPEVGHGEKSAFHVELTNFSGPFDLLLQLISRHKLDVTEVALSVVTDDFIRHLRSLGALGDLDETTEFLLIAATLVDLKAARLLPQGEVEDEEDLALLEARDLLFARLLQYRAYKQMAGTFETAMATAPRRYPRSVTLEDRFAALLPDVLFTVTPEQFAALAGRAMTPRAEPVVGLDHLHAPAVSVREQAVVVVERLRAASRGQGFLTFADLVADAPDILTTIARFLALLELFRVGSVAFDQVTPLDTLMISWTGAASGDVAVTDEFDRPPSELGAGEPDADSANESTGTDHHA